MKVESLYGAESGLQVFSPHSENRAEGLHLSDIYTAIAADKYPKWFKKYDDNPEQMQREINHFTKGLVLEEAWGDALSQMIGASFQRPEQRACEDVWCSPDGYSDGHSAIWPHEYPAYTAPAIHECKVTLKSCNGETSPITHDKYCTWLWQIMGYCYVWNCHTAYVYVLHLMGDYKAKPWTPMGAIHRFDFTAPELAAHWKWLMDEADTRGLRHAKNSKDASKDTSTDVNTPPVSYAITD